MTEQGVMFKEHQVEVRDTKRIVRRAEYDKVKGQQPHFGMSPQELWVLHREATSRLKDKRVAHIEAMKAKGKKDGLKGQTIACPIDAKDISKGLVAISRGIINTFIDKAYYFCVSVNETHESFWWDIDDLAEIFKVTTEDTIVLAVDEALEYHRPINVPLGWPWGMSPIQNLGIDFKGRICLGDGRVARPGFDGYGNLHPSGGESEGYYIK